MKITVLGCGLVGGLIAKDLAAGQGAEVLAVDVSEERLDSLRAIPRITTERADLSNSSEIVRVIRDSDAVVGAVPGHFGYEMLQTVVEAGKPISDISFAPENALDLDEQAKQAGVAAAIDAGVSPGLSNLAVGRAASGMDEVEEVTIYVGGLPLTRFWPWEYRSVFSPTDVIEEYLRPARLVENGIVVTKPALSEVELIDFPRIGTLEAFNTDGLRTIMHTIEATNMKEKTLRYPGHAERMRMLREAGFFSDEAVEVEGVRVRPRSLSERLLFDAWERPEGEREMTYLRVDVAGTRDGHRKELRYELYDETDDATGDSSMARTTGFPCAIIAGMLGRGEIEPKGVLPLEMLGSDPELWERIISGLHARGVLLEEQTLVC